MVKLSKILPAPVIPENLDKNAQWLAGEGAGSWFVIRSAEAKFRYHISRYSPDGILECVGIFITEDSFSVQENFKITYPSHCSKVTVLQNGIKSHLRLAQ